MRQYGVWVYVILFALTFAKTGFVYVPIIPTTTLVFAAGALAAPHINGINWLFAGLVMVAGAFCGDMTCYAWGRSVGHRAAEHPLARRLRLDRLNRAGEFYEKYGLNAVLLARWISIVRSATPFVAGSSQVPFRHFAPMSLAAVSLWVAAVMGVGYVFGENPEVRRYMGYLVAVVLVTLGGPLLYRIIRDRRRAKREAESAKSS